MECKKCKVAHGAVDFIYVELCSFHAAAGELLDALELARTTLRKCNHTYSTLGVVNTAIAKARGKLASPPDRSSAS